MKAPKRSKLKLPEFLAALIRTGYFPQEIPPAITTRHFSNFCRKNYPFVKAEKGALLKQTTNYITFTAPRPKAGRRNLALVHPLGQLAVSLLITEHRAKIKKLLGESGTSLYSTMEDVPNDRAFIGLDFKAKDRMTSKVVSEFSHVLTADISRFFYTVYTHSLPWAVLGKEKAKQWWASGKIASHWSNDFDRALQACQSRETFGIPVGPDTSRVIAEVLLAGIEKDVALSPWLKGRPAFRLVDDFIVGFESAEEANKCLAALRAALWQFNLQLNEEKTAVLPSRALIKDKWELDHDAIIVSDVDVVAQEQDIARIVDLTFHFCSSANTDTPALWTCQRLTRLKNIDQNFSLILDMLFRLAREFPRCSSNVGVFLINNRHRCRGSQAKTRITQWIRETLATHLPQGHDFEVAWSLMVCAALKIKLRRRDIKGANSLPSPIILALLGWLHEHRLLTFSLERWQWRADLKKWGLLSDRWLPFYEAVRRKWTSDKSLVAAVKRQPIFAKMLRENVTFLDDRILERDHIKLVRRPFGTQTPDKVSINNKQAGVRRGERRPKPRGFGDVVITVDDLDY